MNPEMKRPMNPDVISPLATSPVYGSRNKRVDKKVVIGSIIAAIILVGIAVYGVYAYMNNQPTSLLQSALSEATNQKSLAAQLTVTSGSPSVTTKGDIAMTADPTNSKNGELLIGVGSGADRVSVSALSLDGSLYLKAMNIEGLTKLLASTSAPSDAAILSSPDLTASLKNIDTQWFAFTKDDIQSLAQTSGGNNVAGAVSPEDLKRVSQLYMQHKFIKVDKAYSDVVIAGSTMAHFSLKIDQNAEVAFLQAVKNANLDTIKVTTADITDAQQANDAKDTVLEAWIARDTRSFKQLRMTDTKKGSEATITVLFTKTLPAFDSFAKPAGAKPFSAILGALLGSSEGADPLDIAPQVQ